jgi:hypothetical protein
MFREAIMTKCTIMTAAFALLFCSIPAHAEVKTDTAGITRCRAVLAVAMERYDKMEAIYLQKEKEAGANPPPEVRSRLDQMDKTLVDMKGWIISAGLRYGTDLPPEADIAAQRGLNLGGVIRELRACL